MTAVFRTLLLCLLPLSPLAGQRGSAEGGPAKRRDDLAIVPQVTKGNSFLSYDDSRSIGAKATHVRDQDLGGDPIPADGSEGPAPAVGPPRGLNTLPDRPLVFGYLNALRNANGQDQVIADLPAALQAANLEAFDVLITAFAEPLANGGIGTGLGAFSSYLPAVVAEGHALGKSVVVSVGGAYPASLATQFATIAASPTLRQAFSNNIVAFLQQHQLDGVDIDYEFPADAAARANFTLLMQTLHATVKAADPRYLVMFGGGPGWYLGSFDFAALHPHCDFFFYFGYDWKNPANGPLRKPGSIQWTQAGDTLPEASVKGGIDYVLDKGFPANKIIAGLPFYGSNNRSWSAVRTDWAANPSSFAIHPDSLEVQIGGEWFTPPDAMKRKMDALLSEENSALTGGAVIRGVGCWEIGHEHASHPDLSTAFAEWIAGGPADPPLDPPLDPEAGWTSHALAGEVTLTLQVTDNWGSGFQGQLLLHNRTGAALNTWSIQFDAPFTVNSMWDGVYGGKTGNTHSASNPTWGGYSLPDNSTGTIGFTAGGTPAPPVNLVLNGQPVGSSGTSFSAWSSTRGITGATGDPYGDGRPHLVEFLMGSNPTAADPGHRGERRTLTVGGTAADYFCLIVPADRTAADVEYRVTAGPDPALPASRLMILHETVDLGGNRLEAVWRDTLPLAARPRAFARVEARTTP